MQKDKNIFHEQIRLVEEEIVNLKEQRGSIDSASPVNFDRIHVIDARIDQLKSELNILHERLNSLVEPVILAFPLHAELIGLSRGIGVMLSGLIGLAIGIGIAFIIGYLT